MADPVRITYAFPIQQFGSVPSDAVTLALNALVKDINAALLLLGANSAGFVTMKQLKRAMASQAILRTYDNLVPADVTQELNILWNNGSTIAVGDDLYNDIALQVGYTAAQMTTLFNLARTFPP